MQTISVQFLGSIVNIVNQAIANAADTTTTTTTTTTNTNKWSK